ncbi:unnamed protein product [Rotaria sordida]|uniref:Uncharacterized protein n=1 Tax=Rotaria sordida TaxID=392033 RepID=A0A813TAL6_9BILA|nr:unnamed protein product [Rotaria sordida]CAF0806344.1 unnamed protein product [Rotaria sordida]
MSIRRTLMYLLLIAMMTLTAIVYVASTKIHLVEIIIMLAAGSLVIFMTFQDISCICCPTASGSLGNLDDMIDDLLNEYDERSINGELLRVWV